MAKDKEEQRPSAGAFSLDAAGRLDVGDAALKGGLGIIGAALTSAVPGGGLIVAGIAGTVTVLDRQFGAGAGQRTYEARARLFIDATEAELKRIKERLEAQGAAHEELRERVDEIEFQQRLSAVLEKVMASGLLTTDSLKRQMLARAAAKAAHVPDEQSLSATAAARDIAGMEPVELRVLKAMRTSSPASPKRAKLVPGRVAELSQLPLSLVRRALQNLGQLGYVRTLGGAVNRGNEALDRGRLLSEGIELGITDLAEDLLAAGLDE